MGDVVPLDVVTRLDMPAERVLSGALEADLESAVVIGWTNDGSWYFASSLAAGPETLWLLALAQKNLLDQG